MSPDKDQQHFADGVAVEVLNRLVQIADLRVVARTSSFLLRDALDDPRSVGARLGAEHLLTGALRKDGTRVRISVHLVEAATSRQVWTRQLERELADVFAIQDEIAGAVTRALGATLATDIRSLARVSVTSPEAYDLFLRGLSMAWHVGGPNFLKAIELLRRALALDPEFAPAWLGIATVNRALLIFLPERSDEFRLALEEAAAKAIELVPDSWAAHLARSAVHHVERDWQAMDRSLARAAELVARAPLELGLNAGTFRGQVGDTALAIEQLGDVVRDDPLSLMASSVYQTVLLAGGREDEAEAEYRRSLTLPGHREVAEHAALHRAWARGGGFSAELERHIESETRLTSVLTELYQVWDRPERALAVLRAAVADPANSDAMRQVCLAWWLAHYGDIDSALAALKRAYIDRRFVNVAFLWYPVFGELRRDERFKQILHEIGLVDYWRARGNWGDHCRPLADGGFECV